MFCENCGTKLDDGALFCTNCGTKVTTVEATSDFKAESVTESVEAAVSGEMADTSVDGKPEKKVPVLGIIIAAAVAVVIIAGAIFVNIKAHTININDYVTVEFDGYDTMGTAEVVIEDEFWEELYKKADFKEKKKLEKSDFFSDYFSEGEYMENELYKKIKSKVSPAKNLTNGDEVTVTWKVKTDSIKKKYGVTIKSSDKTFKVAELEEVTSFNPFDDVKVTFTGLDGHGEAEIEVTSKEDIYKDFTFYASDSYGLSEGDKITVTFGAYYDEEVLNEMCAEKYGMVPSVVEQEFTVEGLGHYVTDATELTEDSLADMIEQGKDKVTSDANLSDMETINDIKYLGAYLRTEEDPNDGNDAYLLFEINIDLADSDSDATDAVTYFAFVNFSDVSINDEGVCAYESNYGSVYNSFSYKSSFDKNFYYYGFGSVEEARSEIEEDSEWYVKNYNYKLSNTFGSEL